VTLRPTAGALALLVLTMAACADDVGNALEGTPAPSGPTGEPSTAALPLVGTAWVLTAYAGGDVVFSVFGGTDVTASFDADGRVAGSAGCNRFSGGYTSAGTSMTFSTLATTRMNCPGLVMAQESAFLGAMGNVASVHIEGTTLSLLDGHDRVLLSFEGSAG
jgi:heat shock protein HslJ